MYVAPSFLSSSASVKMPCDRDDVAFIAVAPVARLVAPAASTSITSASEPTLRFCSPVSEISPLAASSRIGSGASAPSSEMLRRSFTSSL